MQFFAAAAVLLSLLPLARSFNYISPTQGTNVSAAPSVIRSGAPQPTSNGTVPSLPLPSLATIITGTAGSQVVTETFVPHIFPQFNTFSEIITTTTTLTAGGSPVTVVVGPGGVGWAPYHEPSGAPELLPPSVLPPSAVALLDSENAATTGIGSTSVPPGTGISSRSIPLGTGVSASSSSSTGSSLQGPIETGAATSSNSPVSTGISASSDSSSPIFFGTGSSGSSSGSSASGNASPTALPSGMTSAANTGSSSNSAIFPISYVTTAFNNPAQTITTLSVSGTAAIIYSKETFPGFSTITAPVTIQTSVLETEQGGKTSTFIGGIVVGPGGVYWGPPGLPLIPPFPGISPPCIWPFCTGGGGGGGSNPPGDPNPPPPYTPDDPNTPDSNNPKTQDPSNKSDQPSSTHGSSSQSSASSSSSSSSSCSTHTVTDYWVRCASGTSSACSTYSSSLVSGCSVSAVVSTTASACPLGARVSADPTLGGFNYGNGEYPVLNDGYSGTEQWTYTVAEIVASGVVVGDAGPTNSANSASIANPTASPTTSTSASPGSGASTASFVTSTSNPTSSMSTSTNGGKTSQPSATGEPMCEHFADPDNGVAGGCQCSSGTLVTMLPLLTGLSDQCGYTSFPSPSPTPPPSSNTNPWPFTFTDLGGPIIACKSSSIGNAGVIRYTVCEGDRTTVGTDSSIYNHYTSATAAAASLSAASAAASASAAAVPRADCAFWDEALFWNFEVYNINGWAGDSGDSLHHQENGCGDLTGWSWTTGDAGNDQHAYFNLPFFIKAGCVERAIASAGGPSGLSCTGEGLDKKRRALRLGSEKTPAKRRFRTDVSLSLRERGRSENLQALQKAKREVLSEVKPPSVSERDIAPAPMRLNSRAELAKLYTLDSRDLVKRGCLNWIWPDKTIPQEWWCNCVIPGVDDCVQAIQEKNVVGNYPSLFYTSWGGIGDGSLGVQGTKLWAQNNICGRFVDFDGIVTTAYMLTTESAIEKPFGKDGLNLPSEEKAKIVDPFLKNLSQAFAEETAGEAYVIVPKGVDFYPDSAWTGWEYPALTRNRRVEKIWKVELDASDPSQFGPGGNPPAVKTVLWTPDMGQSAIEPKGARGGQLPAQVPEDQIPPNWQNSE